MANSTPAHLPFLDFRQEPKFDRIRGPFKSKLYYIFEKVGIWDYINKQIWFDLNRPSLNL